MKILKYYLFIFLLFPFINSFERIPDLSIKMAAIQPDEYNVNKFMLPMIYILFLLLAAGISSKVEGQVKDTLQMSVHDTAGSSKITSVLFKENLSKDTLHKGYINLADSIPLTKSLMSIPKDSLLKKTLKDLKSTWKGITNDLQPRDSVKKFKVSAMLPNDSLSQNPGKELKTMFKDIKQEIKPFDSTDYPRISDLIPNDSLMTNGAKGLKNAFSSKITTIKQSSVYPLNKSSLDSISNSLKKQFFPIKPFVIFKNGLINYNYSYRSNLDTPFSASDIQQHLLNVSTNAIIAQKFPIRISVFERRTNSIYFRNYTDVRVEFNPTEFRRLQSQRLTKYFNALTGGLEDPELKPNMNLQKQLLKNLKVYLNKPELIKKFLQSKENIINKNELSGSPKYKDSVIKNASTFIAFYERRQKDVKKAEQTYDSLKNKYITVTKKIQQLQRVFKRNIDLPNGAKPITTSLHDAGIYDRRFEKLVHAVYSVRTLSIGKTMPNYTNLTVKNIGINGINAEFNNNNLYAAIVAGVIEFRARDFIFNRHQPSHQYVNAARLGWGKKDGNHIIFTAYKGRKQLFSSQAQNNVAEIFGVSAESQFIIIKNIRLIAEVAQSAISPSPGILIDSAKKGFSLKDNNSKAWSLQLHAYFPHTRTRIDGLYERQGINFQCFNAYKANAGTDSWNLKADQYLLNGMVHITGGIHKNDYTNQLIQQNYSSNTIFTTMTGTFYKRYWPIVSVGYIPSSQYTVINNQVYESRYQAFTINANHQYKLGMVSASTTAMYNRFYNDSRDSGFIYYNAHNYYINQNIIFAKFTANMSVSHTQNPQYFLDVMEAGLNKNIKKTTTVGFGIKLDHLNSSENQLGYYINVKTNIARLGVLNVWGEKSYLPGVGDKLIKNEFMNIGFTRYFN